jgi:hypothetical protein
MSICLTPEELEQVTGKSERAQKRYGSQAKVLAGMKIPFLRRPDKTLVVLRRSVDRDYKPSEPEPRVEL